MVHNNNKLPGYSHENGGVKMGISFHYSGSIAKPELLPELIEEIKDIAQVYKWKYNIYEREFPDKTIGLPSYNQNIYGISFTPPGCETIWLSFLSNGRMSSPPLLKFWGKTETQAEKEYLYMLSVKTQFASAETHMFIIQLFRYLNKKYFADFKLKDDGEYWETNDETLLETNFKRNAALIDSFKFGIENFPKNKGETIESYLERLFKQIRDKK